MRSSTTSPRPRSQFDESVFKMNGRKGYVWLVTVEDATYLVAAPSRAAAVLDLHFGKLLGIPVVSDGYAVYDIFPVRQRCWAHILREAEKLAIRNGGNDLSCYRRLLSLYKRIKDKGVCRQRRVPGPGEGRAADSSLLWRGPQVPRDA